VNIAQAFGEIFTRNIIHIAFGEDISAEQIEIWHKTDLEGLAPMELTKMPFGKALREVGSQLLTITLKLKVSNPLYRAIYSTTGKSVSFSKAERTIDQNCIWMREFVGKYIEKRRSGEQKSTVQNSADLLSLFF